MRSSKTKSKAKTNKTEIPLFDYYGTCIYGLHSFFVKASDYLLNSLLANKENVKFYAFLSQPLDDLDDIAMMTKAEYLDDLMYRLFPMSGVKFIKNEVSGTSFALMPGKRDVLYKFTGITKNPVFVLNLVYLSNELIKSYPVSMTAVFSADAEESFEFLQCYYQLRQAKARECEGILDSSGSIINSFRTMTWDKIYLPKQRKLDIQNELCSFFESQEAFEQHGLEWRRGILLAGPPGNGKTSVCRAIVTTAMKKKIPVIYCECDVELFSGLAELHSTMAQHAPCVVILEDIDAFSEENPTRTTFLNLLDGLFSCNGTFIVATTNAPEKLNSDITGRPSRLDSYYVIPQPSPEQRSEILSAKLPVISKADIKKLVEDTDGLSFAFIQEIAVCALMESIRSKSKVTMAMLKKALFKVRNHSKASSDGLENTLRGHAGFSNNEN